MLGEVAAAAALNLVAEIIRGQNELLKVADSQSASPELKAEIARSLKLRNDALEDWAKFWDWAVFWKKEA